MLLEWLLAALALGFGSWLLGARVRHGKVAALCVVLCGGGAALSTRARRAPAVETPITTGSPEYAGSGACRACHPQQYSSWHASFHRRMTQAPALDAVAAPELREGGRLRVESSGRSVELFGRGRELWANLPDPSITCGAPLAQQSAAYQAAPSREVRVELLTGSHHEQAFWVQSARQGELCAVPAVYWIDGKRLLPRRDAFLNPPDASERAPRWNSNCIQCHSVAGAPRHERASDAFRSQAAELGIACEACHGAGTEHARAMQNPLARYALRGNERRAAAIVNPQLLGAERGSEVCGRCHSYFFPKRPDEWWESGFARSYRPGQKLADAQLLLSPEVLASPGAPELGASAESLFYRDGTIRVGGREYNGMLLSPCYERGQGERKLSCFSCHSLHESEPDDQLAKGMDGNHACTQCHAEQAKNPTAHTRHAPSSSGSLCYNCHMPRTSYALLGAIRSHRVASPAFGSARADQPNACSLCHLERSRGWAEQQVAAWRGGRRTAADTGTEPAAGAELALSGDAAVRAIVADALGRLESERPGVALRRQLLRELMSDDYAAVRLVAERSLQRLPPTSSPSPLAPELVQSLKEQRDDRPVTIAE